MSGVELIRRTLKEEAFGLTTPLITLSSGAKMGKTEKGAVWLNEKKFSSYDYWQFWRNTADNDVEKFLKYFTEINIKELETIINNEENINNLKILLANEATKILHGDIKSKNAEKTAMDTFALGKVNKNLPEIKLKKKNIENGMSILTLLSESGILSSKSEARRAISNNGVKIDDLIVENEKRIIYLTDFKNQGFIKISFGKKKHYLIKII